jgi:hypothetical protein
MNNDKKQTVFNCYNRFALLYQKREVENTKCYDSILSIETKSPSGQSKFVNIPTLLHQKQHNIDFNDYGKYSDINLGITYDPKATGDDNIITNGDEINIIQLFNCSDFQINPKSLCLLRELIPHSEYTKNPADTVNKLVSNVLQKINDKDSDVIYSIEERNKKWYNTMLTKIYYNIWLTRDDMEIIAQLAKNTKNFGASKNE